MEESMTSTISEENRRECQSALIEKITKLLLAGDDLPVNIQTSEDGIHISIDVPKGNVQLSPHVSELAALISQRCV
jgi:hypothetical protein